MIVYLANKTPFRADFLKERGRIAHSYKITFTDKLTAHPLPDTGVKLCQSA